MINTYKESSLHRTLKELYALNYQGKTEVEADGHIYDILTEEGSVIEIQTQNLGKLKEKLLDSLNKGRKILVVHPIAITKVIETYNQDGSKHSKRKSPKKETIYSLFDELKGIYPLLLQKNFILEVVMINMTETRVKTDKPEQSENKRRRFKRDWQKTDKKLIEIVETITFKSLRDYLALLPSNLPEEFSTKDLKEGFKKDRNKPLAALAYCNLILWTYTKAGITVQTGKKGNAKLYKLSPYIYGSFTRVK